MTRRLGADRRRLLLAGVGAALARRSWSRSTAGSSSSRSGRAAARAGRDARRSRSTRVSGSRSFVFETLRLGGHRPRLLLARVDALARCDRCSAGTPWSNQRRPQARRLARRVERARGRRARARSTTQDAELRRIERDLHDGAQARLVALGMNLGMAEQKLADRPRGGAAARDRGARRVGEALEELRELARGIHPPVLADRGLDAALATLADRSAVPVDVARRAGERLAARRSRPPRTSSSPRRSRTRRSTRREPVTSTSRAAAARSWSRSRTTAAAAPTRAAAASPACAAASRRSTARSP